MTRFLLGRIGAVTLTLVVTSFLVFSLIHLQPGDPATFLLRGRSVSPEVLASIREQYRLDDPFARQYLHWLTSAIQGDFGRSLQFRQDVSALVASRLGVTSFLVGYAVLISLLAGIPLGLAGALRPGLVDKVVLVTTTSATAIPGFVAAIVLIAVFTVTLGWFPVFGNGSGFMDRLWHLTLPAIALAVSIIGLIARVSRAALLAEMRREHVEVATARGIPAPRVVRRHVLRNALPPVVTITGLIVSGMVASTAIVEFAFGLSGVGSLLVQSVSTRDFPVIQAIAMLAVLVFVLVNTAVDLLTPLLDPRLRAAVEGRAS